MKLVSKIAWASFIIWVLFSLVFNFTRLNYLVWPISYFYVIAYSFFVMIVALYKFKMHRYLKTPEGKIFGVVSGIMLFSFLSQVSWVIINIILKESMPTEILGVKPHIVFSSIFMNFSRGIVYLLGIFLLVKIIKIQEVKFSHNRQILWIVIAVLLIMLFDIMFIHPALLEIIAQGNVFLIAKSITDLVCPVMNIFLLLFSLWLFIIIKNKSKEKQTTYGALGLTVVSLIELVYVSLLNKDYYNENMSFLIGLGYIIEFLILAYAANKLKVNDSIKVSKIRLNKAYIEVLNYIKFNRDCIKKDITKKFSITRMTTNAWLEKLSSIGLISIRKYGRTKLIRLSDKGINYLNSL